MSVRQMPRFQKVLLVEDDPPLSQIFKRNLERRGVEVRVAHSTEEAFALLAHWEPDLLLLDVSLPGRTGWDLLRALRAAGRTIPTVIISAVPPSQRRIEEFQPLAYLLKPFPLEALLRIVFAQPDHPAEEIAATPATASQEVVTNE